MVGTQWHTSVGGQISVSGQALAPGAASGQAMVARAVARWSGSCRCVKIRLQDRVLGTCKVCFSFIFLKTGRFRYPSSSTVQVA